METVTARIQDCTAVSYTHLVDTLITHTGLWYRKDWVEQLGFEIKDCYTVNEIMEMMRAVRDEDPGNVGDSLIPMEIPTANLPEVFIYPNNVHARDNMQFYQDENGEYQWGPADESTLYGLQRWRQAYEEGLLPVSYTHLGQRQQDLQQGRYKEEDNYSPLHTWYSLQMG